MWLEFFLILIFILVNGFFAASEIAIVSVRRSRIKKLMEDGIKHAEHINNLKEHPDKFFATIQIGVTAAGAIASAIGGATAVATLSPLIKQAPISLISASADAISIGIVVMAVTYLSLLFGELIPKTLAIEYPERISIAVSPYLYKFSKIANIFVILLTASTNILLKPFGKRAYTKREYITEEEVKHLIEEGRSQGVFEPAEKELIHGVFEFTDTFVKEIMVPTPKMVTLRTNMSFNEFISVISEEEFSRYPMIGKDINDIRGIVHVKEFFDILLRPDKDKADISKLIKLKPPLFIPETMKISNLLREMQKRRLHMAIVVDEYGTVTGLVTLEDILEEIVGEIRDEYDTENPVIELPDKSYIIDPSISIRDLRDDYGIDIPESNEYETLGGFVLTQLQRIPTIGETIEFNNIRLRVIEMVAQRLTKIKLERIDSTEGITE